MKTLTKSIIILFLTLFSYSSFALLPEEIGRKDYDKIDELLYTGRIEKAQKIIDKLLLEYAESSNLHYFKAKALIQLELEDGVQENLELAVKYDSLNYKALYKLASLYYNQTIKLYQEKAADSIIQDMALKAQDLFERYLYTMSSKKAKKSLKNLYIISNTDTIQKKAERKKRFEDVYLIQKDSPSLAEFPGGEKKMYEFIRKEIIYPNSAKIRGIKGRVFTTFIVEKDGQISNVEIIRGLGGGCDEEVLRVLYAMPKWKPGEVKPGEVARTIYRMPVKFTLNEKIL